MFTSFYRTQWSPNFAKYPYRLKQTNKQKKLEDSSPVSIRYMNVNLCMNVITTYSKSTLWMQEFSKAFKMM